jgi:hypothetical protein
MKIITISAILLFLICGSALAGLTRTDEVRLLGYASAVGRGMGCGLNMDAHIYRVFQWLEVNYQEDSPEYAEDFIKVAAQNAQKQKLGEYPEDCPLVQEIIGQILWP